MLRKHFPDIKIRVVNVVDLMTLQPRTEHPHGLSRPRIRFHLHDATSRSFSRFTAIPWLIHRLTYRRTNHDNLHVRGYKEEGTTTTPFDMTVLNELDRFHLAGDVVDRVPRLRNIAAHFKQDLRNKLIEHQAIHRRTRRRHAGNPRLEVALLMKILVLNGGSSTFKVSLFDVEGREGPAAPQPLWDGASTGSIIRRCRNIKVKPQTPAPRAPFPFAHHSNRSIR